MSATPTPEGNVLIEMTPREWALTRAALEEVRDLCKGAERYLPGLTTQHLMLNSRYVEYADLIERLEKP